jgi:hypothetical protein
VQNAGKLTEAFLECVPDEACWSWTLDNPEALNVGQVRIVPVPGVAEVILISTGNDPQFELPLSPALLPEIPGGVLRVCLLGFDMNSKHD